MMATTKSNKADKYKLAEAGQNPDITTFFRSLLLARLMKTGT
jgi:hypothetical protein